MNLSFNLVLVFWPPLYAKTQTLSESQPRISSSDTLYNSSFI